MDRDVLGRVLRLLQWHRHSQVAMAASREWYCAVHGGDVVGWPAAAVRHGRICWKHGLLPGRHSRGGWVSLPAGEVDEGKWVEAVRVAMSFATSHGPWYVDGVTPSEFVDVVEALDLEPEYEVNVDGDDALDKISTTSRAVWLSCENRRPSTEPTGVERLLRPQLRTLKLHRCCVDGRRIQALELERLELDRCCLGSGGGNTADTARILQPIVSKPTLRHLSLSNVALVDLGRLSPNLETLRLFGAEADVPSLQALECRPTNLAVEVGGPGVEWLATVACNHLRVLEVFNLTADDCSGRLAEVIGRQARLDELRLGRMSGVHPLQLELAFPPTLRRLGLAANMLPDSIVRVAAQCRLLVQLDLSNNHLGGDAPALELLAPLVECRHLVALDLSDNQLCTAGEWPGGRLAVEELDLQDNDFLDERVVLEILAVCPDCQFLGIDYDLRGGINQVYPQLDMESDDDNDEPYDEDESEDESEDDAEDEEEEDFDL
jgi:hypothetical protein